jgi:hypothetical protein
MKVLFSNRKIATAQSLKLLGLTIDTSLIWKYHIAELTSRLNKACYDIRAIKLFVPRCTEKYIFFLCSLNYICLTHKYVKSTHSNHPIYTYLQQTWRCTKRVFITQELRSTIIYQQPAKIYLVIRMNSN